jgi:hypothetical protein
MITKKVFDDRFEPQSRVLFVTTQQFLKMSTRNNFPDLGAHKNTLFTFASLTWETFHVDK